VNQLWVADITYIRLHREFVYLAVILDAFSRKVTGWELDRTLAARLPIAALEKAIAERKPPPGVVHHSDRGIQYACGDYADILRKHGMIPSMSRPANPYDKDYASHCTSSIRWGTRSPEIARFDNLIPIAFRGGLSPGCSYQQSFLPL
jgi:putative transposase